MAWFALRAGGSAGVRECADGQVLSTRTGDMILGRDPRAESLKRRPHLAFEVVFWSGDRLLSSTLPKFVQGGELRRVVYPLWACRRKPRTVPSCRALHRCTGRCLPTACSTMMPEIMAEEFFEAAAPEAEWRGSVHETFALNLRCRSQRGWPMKL